MEPPADGAALTPVSAVRDALANRSRWPMPVVVLRFEDTGAFGAFPQSALADPAWRERGRPYQLVAELDRAELDQLASYSEEELEEYIAQVFFW